MPTDEERREVARRLREYVDLPDDWWADTYSGFYVEKCVFGDVERHRESELFARLADLIEPSCDRDALLELACKLDKDAVNIISAARNAQFTGGGPRMEEAKHDAYEWRCIARSIREALGLNHERDICDVQGLGRMQGTAKS